MSSSVVEVHPCLKRLEAAPVCPDAAAVDALVEDTEMADRRRQDTLSRQQVQPEVLTPSDHDDRQTRVVMRLRPLDRVCCVDGGNRLMSSSLSAEVRGRVAHVDVGQRLGAGNAREQTQHGQHDHDDLDPLVVIHFYLPNCVFSGVSRRTGELKPT